MKNICPRCQSSKVFWLKELKPKEGLDQKLRPYRCMNCQLTYWRLSHGDSQGNLVTQATFAKFVKV